MTNILRSLSFNITQFAYPLISYLYTIFELISKNKYFSSEDIEALSGNIYIIISVCMLFTLGLKLLSAIVNPDALAGSSSGDGKSTKRTAKNVFFSIVFSVFLIIIIPIAFKFLYAIQEDIIERQVIQKIVLGVDTSEDSKPGQILAAYSFASFCRPNEKVSSEVLASDGGNVYNLAITEDINKIKEMDDLINTKTDGEYDLEYQWILSPAVGVFLAYEMILNCIDIALRSIKLGLLELITAIILCGYIVSGTDILKRWFSEVFKTYINIFLKVAAMSFMVFGLSKLNNFLTKFEFDESVEADFWMKGLIRVFVIIGLLQLIKQIPNLINTIFGTNIQSRGGIRGRLGEMAAVGQLAQQGWDRVRNKAIGIGAMAALGPAGWIGAGAGILGGAALKHQWNKGWGNTRAWKDRKGGVVLRHVGGVGKGLWTAASSKKGVVGSLSEGVKAYTDTEVFKAAAGRRETDKINTLIGNMKKDFGVGEDGRISAVSSIKVGEGGVVDDKQANELRTKRARDAEAQLNGNITNQLNRAGASALVDDVIKLSNASRTQQLASAAKGSYMKIDEQLSNLAANTNDADLQRKIAEIQGKYRKGDYSATRVLQELTKKTSDGGAGFKQSEVGGIMVEMQNFNHLLESKIYDDAGNEMRLDVALGTKAKGTHRFSISDISNEANAIETVYNSRKSDLTDAMDKAHVTDIQKTIINKTVELADLTHKTVADTQKKWNG